MIEALSAWVRDIVYVVLFASFVELLLPSSSMQKFVRVILGLFIMIAILNPIINLINSRVSQAEIPALRPINSNSTQIIKAGNDIAHEREMIARDLFKKDLAKQIAATVKAIEGVSDAKVSVVLNEAMGKGNSVEIKNIIVYVDERVIKGPKINEIVIGENTESKNEVDSIIQAKVKRTITEIYQVRTDQINIKSWTK